MLLCTSPHTRNASSFPGDAQGGVDDDDRFGADSIALLSSLEDIFKGIVPPFGKVSCLAGWLIRVVLACIVRNKRERMHCV